jgi:hypothetical protein
MNSGRPKRAFPVSIEGSTGDLSRCWPIAKGFRPAAAFRGQRYPIGVQKNNGDSPEMFPRAFRRVVAARNANAGFLHRIAGNLVARRLPNNLRRSNLTIVP